MSALRHLAVFRALMLGDLLCATPALRALRAHFADARITFIGLPWAEAWAARQSTLDDFIAFPGHAALPEQPVDAAVWPDFATAVHGAGFDRVLQLHGDGRVTNPLLAALVPAPLVGFHPPGLSVGDGLAQGREWPERGSEVERLLLLTDLLGAPRQGTHLDWPLRPEDRRVAAELLGACGVGSHGALVCLHAGAQLPSRRWPAERFARVAEALIDQGLHVVLTGVASEQPLAEALCAAVAPARRAALSSLVGRTSLWSLGALIAEARLLVCNDTGVSHIAAALGTPSVVVSCGADVARWSPQAVDRHRVLWADQPCRPCAEAICPIGHPCARQLGADAVIDACLQMLGVRSVIAKARRLPTKAG